MINREPTRRKYCWLIRLIFWTVAIILGLAQAWGNRYEFFSGDIISYLEMGEAYLRGDWEVAIHGYFSPLYPLILSSFLAVLKPPMYWEIFSVKLVNFFIYLFSLVGFELFLSGFIKFYRTQLSQERQEQYVVPDWIWLVLGYFLFLWAGIKWIGIHTDTPDMLVAGLVYLAMGMILRISLGNDSWLNFAFLGAVLGLGYLAKTVMLPAALIFFLVCFFSLKRSKKSYIKILFSFLIFLSVITPLISSLSIQKGYFTFGEAGKLNRAFTFQGVPARYWQGEPPGTGTPENLPQKLFEDPDVYAFDTTRFERVTLPIRYDPSFWYEGLTVNSSPFSWTVIENLRFYYQQFFRVLLFGYVILIFASNRPKTSLIGLLKNWSLLIPGIAILGAYAISKDFHYFDPEDVDTRLLAPFVVLLFAGVLSSVRLPDLQQSRRLVAGLAIGTLILLSSQLTSSWEHPGSPVYWKVAQQLQQLGLQAGDEVAVIQLGPNRPATTEYWARLARVRVVAEITDSELFWQADEGAKTKIYELINQVGARAIVCKQDALLSALASAQEWIRVNDTDYYVYLLNH